MSAGLPGRLSASSEATAAGAPGPLLLIAGCGLLAGPVGVAAGLATVGLWLVAPAIYAVAAGHVLLAVLAGAGAAAWLPAPAVLLAEAGLLWALLAPEIRRPDGGRVVVGGLVATAVGVGLVVWLAPAGVHWAAAGVLVVLAGPAVAGVGLDRLVAHIEGEAGVGPRAASAAAPTGATEGPSAGEPG